MNAIEAVGLVAAAIFAAVVLAGWAYMAWMQAVQWWRYRGIGRWR